MFQKLLILIFSSRSFLKLTTQAIVSDLPKTDDVPLKRGTMNAGKSIPHFRVCVDNDSVVTRMVSKFAAFEYKEDAYHPSNLPSMHFGIQPLLDSHATIATDLCQMFSLPVLFISFFSSIQITPKTQTLSRMGSC
jgi:hypothetical protein